MLDIDCAKVVHWTTCGDEQSGVPVRGTEHAAGWDLTSAQDAVLLPYQSVLVKTSLCIEIPRDCFLAIVPRSGFSTKHQIFMPNSIGIVDADYRGEIGIPLMWMPNPLSVLEITHPKTKQYGPDGSVIGERWDYARPELSYKEKSQFRIDKGSRIAQVVLMRYYEQDWRYVDELSETSRGTNGFGSTGL